MSEAQITFDLVTPEKVVSSQQVEQIAIPGKEGDYGVLAGHAPMITSIRPGVIRVIEGDKVVERILVTSGFAEVTPERCTILATEAFDFDDKSVDAVKARQAAAKKAHEEAKSEKEKVECLNQVDTLQAVVDSFIQENDSLK